MFFRFYTSYMGGVLFSVIASERLKTRQDTTSLL